MNQRLLKNGENINSQNITLFCLSNMLNRIAKNGFGVD